MVLLIDNYDGCVNNLYQLIGMVNPAVEIVRNDRITIGEIATLAPTHIVISGGSAQPENIGIVPEVIATFAGRIPILGICLGCRVICAAYGASMKQMEIIAQGKASKIRLDTNNPLFKGLPQEIMGARYHSVTVDPSTMSDTLKIIASADDDKVMGIQHRTATVYGLQFHPESFLSDYGIDIMKNFLGINS